MLTLITGTPGAGKSLHAVWEFARKVPGSTIEDNGNPVPRKLYSNVKDLLVEHEHITGEDLDRWHTWAKPGDVIMFDEVQEVWRPRGLGTKVPDCIAKLETHRHMGVDIVLITQHPMLVDPNIRRLVNQHLHLRRITKTVAWVYEWDHCANPGQTRTCVSDRVWFHPKAAYKLYKSAQLHTKPTARIPRIAFVGLIALGALAYMGPVAYGRIKGTFDVPSSKATQASPKPQLSSSPAPAFGQMPLPESRTASAVGGAMATPVISSPVTKIKPLGCIASASRCACYDQQGDKVDMPDDQCRLGSHTLGFVIASSSVGTVPSTGQSQSVGVAAAPGGLASQTDAGEVWKFK